MDQKTYLNPTPEAGRALFQRQLPGKVVMLNLLKFREIADYSASPELAPDTPISGEEAYQLYAKHTLPYLEGAGSKAIFYGKGGPFLIGPESEKWDAVLLVEHASVARFIEFAQNQGYLKGAGHRTAALEDSRLLPITKSSLVTQKN